MQIAHRDKFPFTDLSLLMGIREKGFNWLAANMSAERTHALSRGCRVEERDYSESRGGQRPNDKRCLPSAHMCMSPLKKTKETTHFLPQDVVERADL